ncbi:ABC transporter ATP-binding protein [Pandoraea norimbergensis]|uniref:Sugar ABC transporter substrate-binding protein n=1 Tax=Pandoraea norimbergensis TaxID=93219 RepID=A0ABN4JD11_9BURK|nr:ABC transporter ATP-binding protein [Pandoraea norimbergensis]ALS58745.1 sugar ABC transporter substrate-binding protein [Pandoraea norimbergensis]
MNANKSAPSSTSRGALVFENVRKGWGTHVAIPDLSFTVAPGALTTLLGPSGCGKTTTLRLIAGLELPDAGRITLGGRDVTRLGARDRDVSMVFQSYALFPHMKVFENVAYGLTVTRVPQQELRERVFESLTRVGLASMAQRMPAELSGGQQQRVAVARALVLEPEVMLFDEPLSNLDARLRVRVREDIRDLQTQLGLTVVYVTHDQEEALAISDQVVVMHDGRIAQQDAPRTLVEQPADAFVATFISNANLIDLPVTEQRDGHAQCDFHGLLLRLPYAGPALTNARVAIRPEALTLQAVPHTEDRADALHGPIGEIRRATYLGRATQYFVQTSAGDLVVLSHQFELPFPVGTRVAVGLHARGAAIVGAAQ